MLVSDRVIECDCLMVYVLRRDKPRVVMRMHDATISLKSPFKQGLLVITLDV